MFQSFESEECQYLGTEEDRAQCGCQITNLELLVYPKLVADAEHLLEVVH